MSQLCEVGDTGLKYQHQCLTSENKILVLGWSNHPETLAQTVLLHPSWHSHKAVERHWECDVCMKRADHLQISWGMVSGQKVDVIDYFCTHCGHSKLTFRGTHAEIEAYWRMEWDSPCL